MSLFGKDKDPALIIDNYPSSLKFSSGEPVKVSQSHEKPEGFYDLDFTIKIPSITSLFDTYFSLSVEIEAEFIQIEKYINKLNTPPKISRSGFGYSASSNIKNSNTPQKRSNFLGVIQNGRFKRFCRFFWFRL